MSSTYCLPFSYFRSKSYDVSEQQVPLKKTLAFLDKQPAYRQLKKVVGVPQITIDSCDSGAFCETQRNRIFLDPSEFDTKIGKIHSLAAQSIFFEMCNLAQKDAFRNLVNRARAYEFTPDEFVQQFEEIEYRSALRTKCFVRQTFDSKDWKRFFFGDVSDLFIYHYLAQQLTGHSQAIWMHYKSLFPPGSSFQGSWKTPILQDEKKYVVRLVVFKGMSVDRDPQIAACGKMSFKKLKERIIREAKNGSPLFSRLKQRVKEVEIAERSFPEPIRHDDHVWNSLACNSTYPTHNKPEQETSL